MFFPLLAFSSYLLLIGPARAQVSAPNCTDSTFNWSFNSLQQNPCWVSAYLSSVCSGGSFLIPALLPQHSYTGPTGISDYGDICKCNTVVYNLMSACDACQGESWIPYSTWSFNCTTKATPGTFPEPVPAGTRVPKWAYIDTSFGDNWNISEAQRVGDSPEVTGTALIVATSTSEVTKSTITPDTSSSSTPISDHSSNTGAIAGGVVGGIIAVALIAGVVLWFVIRRRRARSVPSAPYEDPQGSEKEQLPPHPLAEGTLKIYDPSDPATYPSKEYLPLEVSNQRVGSTNHQQQPSDSGYSGLPEV
ncbi:hypothetical protein BJY52DRAFT_366461 [Lactarius psammicola]|nr:hypothetical protein BJY52DRAFT_366461 [Lactarius psammicola]